MDDRAEDQPRFAAGDARQPSNPLQAGIFELECRPLDVRTVIGDVIATTFPLLHAAGQTLEVDVRVALPVVGDRRRIEQVLVDVLANAIEYSPRGTSIAITAYARGTEICFSIAGNGPGLLPHEVEAIVERFHRREAGRGSGLGLAASRGIVELHGGTLWAESMLGRGATFQIVLPRAEI